jgi:hypothetical protein
MLTYAWQAELRPNAVRFRVYLPYAAPCIWVILKMMGGAAR